MRVAGISWGTYWALKWHIAQSQGGLAWSIPLRSEGSWGERGGWSLWLEAMILKASSRDHQAWVHSDQMVLMLAKQEAGPWKQSWTQRLHSRKVKPKATQDTLGSQRSMWQQYWVLKNLCAELSISWPTVTTKERGRGQFSLYTSHVVGGRERIRIVNIDNRPGPTSLLPAELSCNNRVYKMYSN